MTNLVWDTYICPRCGETVSMGVMSLSARCQCGLVYCDGFTCRGWYDGELPYYVDLDVRRDEVQTEKGEPDAPNRPEV